MIVNIKCEFSGVVREAFRLRGHDVLSYDLIPSLDNSPYHITGDCRQARKADLNIWHPVCTMLTVAGARRWNVREDEQRQAARFFLQATQDEGRWCIENPIGIMSRWYRKPDQIIQPWMFGHGETKATCLWLKGLPKLVPTNIVSGRVPRVHFESPGIVNGLTRKQRRSITYQGIADAMAEQWGNLGQD